MFGKVSHQFDAEHRLSQRVVQGNSLTNALTVTIDYSDDDIPTRIGNLHYTYTYPSGRLQNTTIENISDTRIYDSYGNLAEYAAYYNPPSGSPQLLYSYVLTRDDLNRITTKVETIQGTTTTYNYAYDIMGRLSTVHRNGLPYSCYFYDANGNRINGVINGVPFIATYDNQDRVLTYAGITYTHTADGYVDLVTYPDATTQQYVFDTLGNFRTVKLRNNQTEFYQHDGQYRLVSLFLGSTLQYRRIYAENDRIVARVNNSGVLSESYVYGARNTPEYFYKNSAQHRVITDHLGSVRLVVNTANGTVVQRMDYNEWGDVLNDTSPGFQPYGFAGGIYLVASKTVKFGARVYDPSMGRWLTKDPILFGGGDTNLYGYTFSDPVNFIDPTGLDACGMNQATGTVVCIDNNGNLSAVDRNGYSGNGAGKNNPSYQNVENTGPIPVGSYTIGPSRPGGHMGPDARLLTPTPATRASFPPNRILIHLTGMVTAEAILEEHLKGALFLAQALGMRLTQGRHSTLTTFRSEKEHRICRGYLVQFY
ncbi:MAG: DUF2778 domain-containing protein [Bdellovibrio sp.]|nr:DUF2778 domain-containing protein [Bdellovibrio sp.]